MDKLEEKDRKYYKQDFDWDFISKNIEITPLTATKIPEINIKTVVLNNI